MWSFEWKGICNFFTIYLYMYCRLMMLFIEYITRKSCSLFSIFTTNWWKESLNKNEKHKIQHCRNKVNNSHNIKKANNHLSPALTEHDFRVIYSINSIITFRTDIQVYTNQGVKLIAFATDRLQGITSVFERRCYRKLTTFPKVNIGAIQTTCLLFSIYQLFISFGNFSIYNKFTWWLKK
jgi:hypothetical protein